METANEFVFPLASVFQALKDAYQGDISAREKMTQRVAADGWSVIKDLVNEFQQTIDYCATYMRQNNHKFLEFGVDKSQKYRCVREEYAESSSSYVNQLI